MEFIYACEEHIDEAMDEVIEKKCSYCSKEAKYEVKVI